MRPQSKVIAVAKLAARVDSRIEAALDCNRMVAADVYGEMERRGRESVGCRSHWNGLATQVRRSRTRVRVGKLLKLK